MTGVQTCALPIWVEHRFQKEDSYTKGSSAAERAAEEVRRAARKDFGLSLFSTIDELRAMALQQS